MQNLFINFRMSENLCLNFIIKLSSWLFFFTYLGDEESPRKRKKRKKRKVHRMTKTRFRRRTFHEPNLIRIKADPNYLDRLN